MRRKSTLAERFWKKVAKTDGCWLWQGAILRSPLPGEGGYGVIGRGGRGKGNLTAHRASWLIHFGQIPDGLWVLHKCDVRHCVRPDHLFLGDHPTNMADMRAKGRHGKTHRPMRLGEANPQSKLGAHDVVLIRQRYAQGGYTLAALGTAFNVHFQTIWDIVHRRTWKHLQG